MNRILLVPLVTAALAAAGCNSSRCDATDLTFFWRFVGAPIAGQPRVAGSFTAADNGCAAAGIDGIDVTFDDGSTFQFFCGDQGTATAPNVGVPGVTFAGTPRGVYGWRVDAIRAGQVAFTKSGTTDVRSCGANAVDVDLQAVSPSPLVVYYDVNGQAPAGCRVAGVPVANVVFELRDAANRIVDSSCVGGRDPATSACLQEGVTACDPVSLGFVVPGLPVGAYELEYLELYGTSPTPLAAACAVGPTPNATTAVVHDGFPAFVNLNYPVASACTTTPATP